MWLALLVAAASAAALAYAWSERNGYARLDDAAARQLELHAAVLENELGKHAYLPGVLRVDGDIAALLHAPRDAALRDAVSRKLTRFNVQAGALATFVIDAQGVVAASSDWYRPDSLLGRDLSSLPYFASARRGEQGRFFVPSAAGGAPEYYFAQPLVRDERVLGSVVVRISLAALERTWIDSAVRADSEKPLVVDERGVVILSSQPAWKFKALAPMSAEQRARLAGLGVYAGHTIEPLGMVVEQPLEHGAQLVRMRVLPSTKPVLYVLHERPVPRFGWRLMSLSDASEVWRTARLAAWGAGAITGFVGLFLLYQVQRRRVVAQKLAARAALQRAHDELEIKVQQRTAELQASNAELQHEIVERRHAEAVLRQAQEELVQAGKLALLGQMSASISHEIGQPLTAMRALSENARLLLERGQPGEVADNLAGITDLVERMGRITKQLKSFARKTPEAVGPVQVASAVRNAQQLLGARIALERVELRLQVGDDLVALCDGYRLEQVLVNLMSNAIDAMHACERRRITVRAWRAEGRVMMRLSDSGPGIPPAQRARLFEPFFTTKPPDAGLGLGLAISANIVHEFGGTLRAVEGEDGAAFEFDLLAAEMSHV
ncbi:MAG TPA: ATP-binding protein [Albitalea sp.]